MIGRFATTAAVLVALGLATPIQAEAQAVSKSPAPSRSAPVKQARTLADPADRVVPPLPPLPPAEPTTIYIVRKGDTLWGLGDKYFLRRPTYEEVRVRNGVRYVRRIAIGRELIIPTRLLRTRPVDAVLGAFKGDVTIAGGGVTGPLRVGLIVREGAVISTGGDAFARIDLPDGSRVSIPSQSRVRLDILHQVLLSGAVERTFAVQKGRTESTVAPITRPQDNYFVRTPVSVSAVRGTDFRVGYEEGGKAASTGVVVGTVGVNAPDTGASVSVPAAFGVGVKAGAPLTVVPLLPAPALTTAGHIEDGPVLTVDLQPVAGAKAYRVQLATDTGMQEIFAEQTLAGTHFEFPGPAGGDYVLRATAIDPADIEGLPRVSGFKYDPELPNSITAIGVTVEGSGADRRFVFRWRAGGPGPRTFRFQAAREPSAEAPYVDEGGLKNTEITVTSLPPGDYRWRVMSATMRKGGLVETWTPSQTFTVPAN